jgi:hypothetical protein
MKAKHKEQTGSGGFSPVPEGAVIISSKGRYRQVVMVQRGTAVFAEVGKDQFVRLLADGVTTDPSIGWDEIIGVTVKSAPIRGIHL